MFEKTASLWRLLTNQQASVAPSQTASATAEDRRVFVRHPCDLRTQYEPAEADETPLPVRIVDISRGGAKLIAERGEQPGSMISLELPGPDGKTACAALACVIHSQDLGDGEWALGCSFSLELDDVQMRAFGVGSQHEKRIWPRFTADVTAVVQLTNGVDEKRWPATVLDLSAGGVALSIDHDIRNGTLLNVDLSAANGHHLSTILACIVHITTQDDGTRRLGCNFIRELEESDLAKLI